jgi:hypothetical protein
MEDKDMETQTAYIQITHVVPYFDEEEQLERVTEFERNHNIKRFMYEIPFTTDGKVRGNPEEQCKRRIILTSSLKPKRLMKMKRISLNFFCISHPQLNIVFLM